jgi:hypothetical protein
MKQQLDDSQRFRLAPFQWSTNICREWSIVMKMMSNIMIILLNYYFPYILLLQPNQY